MIQTWTRFLSLSVTLVIAADVLAADRPVDFTRDIRSILSNNCYFCHGPDKNQLQAGLRLDKPDIAMSKLESGQTAIVPKDIAGLFHARTLTRCLVGVIKLPLHREFQNPSRHLRQAALVVER